MDAVKKYRRMVHLHQEVYFYYRHPLVRQYRLPKQKEFVVARVPSLQDRRKSLVNVGANVMDVKTHY